jgi:methionyl aminopeptidase
MRAFCCVRTPSDRAHDSQPAGAGPVDGGGTGIYADSMSIETREELDALRAAGRVVAEALRAMRRSVRPGVTTAELDDVGARVFRRHGARSGPQLDYGFPGVNCISVGDEAVHGIPGARRLREGELVKLDVTAELDGFYADACVSVPVGRAAPQTLRLVATARRALNDALGVARAGLPLNAIGAAVERTVTGRGHSVCTELTGHGIGRRIHELPHVPNHYVAALDEPLTDGLVLTIEPIISAGSGAVVAGRDGWTIRTADGALSAHAEHTLVITHGAPLLLTA